MSICAQIHSLFLDSTYVASIFIESRNDIWWKCTFKWGHFKWIRLPCCLSTLPVCRSGSKAPHSNSGIRHRSVVCFRLWPLYRQGISHQYLFDIFSVASRGSLHAVVKGKIHIHVSNQISHRLACNLSRLRWVCVCACAHTHMHIHMCIHY